MYEVQAVLEALDVTKATGSDGIPARLLKETAEVIAPYLSNRRQRVTALGATSNTLPVTSGVPQGSILGPILFLLYVHDLPGLVKSSQVAMFADDTKIFKSIASINDTKLLQQDLSNLESWSSTSGLPFNQSKCRSLSITRKTKPVVTTYKMKGETLEITKSERDLGVWMSTDLTWNNQVVEQSSRANKLLGYIRWNARFIQREGISTPSLRICHPDMVATVHQPNCKIGKSSKTCHEIYSQSAVFQSRQLYLAITILIITSIMLLA